MELRGYFDNNATTPLDPRVREAVLPWHHGHWGNPSSIHAWGRDAGGAVEAARAEVAELLAASPHDVVMTASGTEANVAVIATIVAEARGRGRIVLSALEHPSIRVAAERAAETGLDVVTVEPSPDGVVSPESVLEVVTEETRLVALMLASNETGVLQPVAEVGAACRERGVPVLCDAVQAVGKVPVEVPSLGCDYVTLGGHKFHGPLGAAALWVRPGAALEPLLVGGGQERGRRAGTVNVPAVVGLGAACRLARVELDERHRHLLVLRERLESAIAAIPDATIHGAAAPRLPHTTHVAFRGVENVALAIRLDLAGFGVSTGAACSSGKVKPSRVLLSMGVEPEVATSSLRISFGMGNTLDEVEAFVPVLEREVARLRDGGAPP